MNRLNIKRTVGSCLMAMAFFSCTHTDQTPAKDFVDYVNPYIGNISHLLVPTYPTVHLPNSMLRVYPERGDYTSDRVNGLPVVVTSHRGSSAFNLRERYPDRLYLTPMIWRILPPIVIPYTWMRLIYRLSMPLHIRLVFIISVLGWKVIMLWW